ncbi:MAG: hypothetical protein IKH04_10425 [Kiritimatiellae bacterium]|nr:hypothetical protein [Kiritimatiellia bacterium]
MAVSATTTTTATGAVVIRTVLTDGENQVGEAVTTFESDDTSGSTTEGHRSMRSSIYYTVPAEGDPFANLKAVASGLEAHFASVGTYLESITEG